MMLSDEVKAWMKLMNGNAKEELISQKYLKSILKYNDITGDFYWIDPPSNNSDLDIAGTVLKRSSGKRHIVIQINGDKYYAHRLAFMFMLGSFPQDQVDHINGNGIDNRWVNIRDVAHLENHHNKRIQSNNTSKCSGVNYEKRRGKWRARIQVDGRRKELGQYNSYNDAVIAKKMAEYKHGFHANHGDIREL